MSCDQLLGDPSHCVTSLLPLPCIFQVGPVGVYWLSSALGCRSHPNEASPIHEEDIGSEGVRDFICLGQGRIPVNLYFITGPMCGSSL